MSVANANANNPQSSSLVCICTFCSPHYQRFESYFLLTVRIFIFIFMRIVLFIYCTVLRIVLFITENSTVCKNNCSLSQ